jgi:hypothetical protein
MHLIDKIKQFVVARIRELSSSELVDLRVAIGQSAILSSRLRYESLTKLWDAEVKVFSQWGEDGILDYIFERLGISKPKIIEFGAGNLAECNSRYLAESRNASVYAIDAREGLISNILKLEIYWKNAIYPVEDWITPKSAKIHFAEAFCKMGGIDLVSMDIDGNDYWVARELSLLNVSVIVVEYNPIFGATASVSVPNDDKFDRTDKHYSNLYYGASLMAWINLFREQNFEFIGSNRVGNNAFFIKRKLLSFITFPIPNQTDLEMYVDWRVRESRNKDGQLSFLNPDESRNLIFDLPLVETVTGKTTKLRAFWA